MRAIPYTTSSGADGTGTGRASGSRRAAADLARCRAAGGGDDRSQGLRGHGCLPGERTRPTATRTAEVVWQCACGDFPPSLALEALLEHAGR